MLEQIKSQMAEQLPLLKEEHAKLGDLIAAAERFLGESGGTEGPQHPDARAGARQDVPGPQRQIRPDEFFGMSTHVAVKAYLARVGKGHPQGPREIAHALVQGGYSKDEKATYVNVSSALKRMNGMDVVQVKRGQWGLRSWYPGYKPPARGDQNGSQGDETGKKEE